MIEVQKLTKYYGDHVAVDEVSFQAQRGEILGFLGPNGAGKTTTMRMLTCYLPPTSGTAIVAGFDVLDQSIEVRRRIGYLPENVPLYSDLSVVDYLDFVARLKGMTKSSRTRRIGEVMEECGITDVQRRTIGKLSKGYRQRIGLAQALVNDPEVLILDEPTVGLDPQQIVEIRALIRGLSGQRTIILSTHILPEVSLLCRRVIIINNGRLVTVDTPDNLKSRLRRTMVLDVLVRGEAGDVSRHLEALPGTRSVECLDTAVPGACRFRIECRKDEDMRESVARSLVESGFGLLGLEAVGPSLEEIFVQLVTNEEVK